MVLMSMNQSRSVALLGLVAVLALAIPAPGSAQVINGESTYGDSDLHQKPAETSPAEPPGRDTRTPPRPSPDRQ